MATQKIFFTLLICCCLAPVFSFGQNTVSLSPAIERQFNKIESDIISAANAMPEEQFNFSPETLNIKKSAFKGVRTFSGQILHLATDNILIWSTITGDSVRTDIEDVNGPKNIKTKKKLSNT